MDQLVVDVIALDLTRHGQVRLAVDDQVEQDVGAARGVQHVHHLARIDRKRRCLLIVSVEDGGHPARGAELAGHSLATVLASFGFQLRIHGRSF